PTGVPSPSSAGYIKEGIAKMPDPPGPAPKHDLTGAWVGPQNMMEDPVPPMTPAGEAAFKTHKPKTAAQPWGGNDPYQTCDPLGFPRNLIAQAVSARGQMWFEPVPNRMTILYGQQRVWRDVWMDGRQLPAKVDARGYPDARFYGYSIGHWEDDSTFVIDTTGVDERTWLDEHAHPHSTDAHFQERYTRVDQYNLRLTVTIDDPKFYTKPWAVLKANYYWMKDQDFTETFCVPSEALAYRDKLANPSGNVAGANTQRTY
ncbi:MAG: hypothetical protein ACREIC_05865, partial [Limisphaerales bacterium]